MKEDKPSQTALWIAKGLLYLDKTTAISNYLEPQAIEIYKACLQLADSGWLDKLSRPFYQKKMHWLESVTIPGIFIHYFLRKQIIKRWMLEAIEQKTQQVVVLAAGFDGLVATYYSQYPEVKFIEIDHPATQQVKKKAFYRNHFASQNVSFLSADLSKKSLKEVLQNAPELNRDLKTFFIIEGLTMYLTQEENLQLFHEITDFFKNELLVAFSFMKKQANGSIDFKQTSMITKLWLKYQKEVFKWGCPLAELEVEFLRKNNLKLVELLCPKNEANLYKGIFLETEIAEGEYLCLAKGVGDKNE